MLRRYALSISSLLFVVLLAACNAPAPAGQAPDSGAATPQASATRAVTAATAVSAATPAASTVVPRAAVLTPVPLPAIVQPTAAPAYAPAASGTANAPDTTALPVAPQANATAVPGRGSAGTLATLHGKILFFTDREGSSVQLYVMDADGSNAEPCNCSDVLQAMVKRDITSPDQKQFLFVKQVGGSRITPADQQIWSHNNETDYEAPLVGGAPGFPGVDYAPAWSPDSEHIAWVSEVDGNDEIYSHDTRTNEDRRLTENDKAWDKHPSYSPDGSQLVFWSNRESAIRKQIWLMNGDGGGQHNISHNSFSDYDPYWVK